MLSESSPGLVGHIWLLIEAEILVVTTELEPTLRPPDSIFMIWVS